MALESFFLNCALVWWLLLYDEHALLRDTYSSIGTISIADTGQAYQRTAYQVPLNSFTVLTVPDTKIRVLEYAWYLFKLNLIWI